jgi:uncharacterized protein (TIGR02246 family)
MSQSAAQLYDVNSVVPAIESLMRRHEQAWNTHDRAAFEALFTDDADFVNVLGHHRHGRIGIGEDFEQIHRTFMRNTRIEIESADIRTVDAHTAIAHIHWSMTGMAPVPGWNTPDVRRGLLLYVAVERAGEWKIRVVQNTEKVDVPMPK